MSNKNAPGYSRVQMGGSLVIAIVATSLGWYFARPQQSPLSPFRKGANLTDAIENLRDELEKAAVSRKTSSSPAVFELNTVDVELDVVAKQSTSGEGKLEYEVVTVGMKRELGFETTHKVVLHLTPLPQVVLTKQGEDSTLDSNDAVQE